ncbi:MULTISPECIES: aldehyde dehydrogenase [Enterococcus]|uniref:Aldehyde dehydrogenase n=1 Tax=Candidatus Enterococcus mangumiae TaxID=2230878 RepID=A0ABZ2SX60_9ENTE|nr:aldehyde dehydrogenase [Enterococcus sp. DIV1298c]MBO0489624.1 aldehyde dehydrogenase [Enterococcus sp. DIV1094]MBO1298442.1 aldehyde dehydrogenase [Enterococcus sp. DIV1271a]
MINQLLREQQHFFATGQTKSIDFRLAQLAKLKHGMKEIEIELTQALYKDLRKPAHEAYVTEIGVVYQSISMMIKKLKKFAKRQPVHTPIYMWGKSYLDYEPYGQVLIIAPFNYPFHLAIEPLIGAIAAGNTVILKPSELAPNVSNVLTKLIRSIFPKEYITTVEGGVDVTTELLAQRFDYIFFTGSVPVGKIVMQAAAKHLTPVTLELGGKSPVVVDDTANLKLAAKRIIWGKLQNNGQTCIAPDYVLVSHKRKEALIKEMTAAIKEFYGADIRNNTDYGRIINDRHFVRLHKLLEADQSFVIAGGETNRADLFIEPTLLDLPSHEAVSMQEEIFGPILPILSFDTINDAIAQIKQYEKPLALYLFTTSTMNKEKIMSEISSGNVTVNDVLKHVANHHLPFGGVGESGIGSYHGKYSFLTFSHKKGVYENRAKFNVPGLFPPYNERTLKLLKRILK